MYEYFFLYLTPLFLPAFSHAMGQPYCKDGLNVDQYPTTFEVANHKILLYRVIISCIYTTLLISIYLVVSILPCW